VDKDAGILQSKESEVQEQKNDRASDVEIPSPGAHMVEHWVHEKEAQIKHPEKRAPSVVGIFENRVPWLQLPWTPGPPALSTNWNQRHGSIFAPSVNFGHSAQLAQRHTR